MRNRLMIGTAALLLASATLAGAQDKPQQSHHLVERHDQPRRALHGRRRRRGALRALPRPAERRRRQPLLRQGDGELDVRLPGEEHRLRRRPLRAELQQLRSGRSRPSSTRSRRTTRYYTRTPYNCTAGDCSLDADLRSQVQARTATGVWTTAAQALAGGTVLQRDRQPVRPAVAAGHDRRGGALLGHRQPRPHRRRQHLQALGQHAVGRLVRVPRRRSSCRSRSTTGRPTGSAPSSGRATRACPASSTSTRSSTRASRPCAGTTRSARPTSAGPASPASPRARAGTRAATRTATGRPSAAWPCRRRTRVDRFNWMGMIKLPERTTANASLSTGINQQDNELIPWTTNTPDQQRRRRGRPSPSCASCPATRPTCT